MNTKTPSTAMVSLILAISVLAVIQVANVTNANPYCYPPSLPPDQPEPQWVYVQTITGNQSQTVDILVLNQAHWRVRGNYTASGQAEMWLAFGSERKGSISNNTGASNRTWIIGLEHLGNETGQVTIQLNITASNVITYTLIVEYESTEVHADSWAAKSAYQATRYAVGLAVVDDKIYALGGCLFSDGGVPCKVNQEYNPETDKWTTKKSMPSTRGGSGVAAYEGEIYVFGGSWFLSGSGTDTVWSYNPSADTWNQSKTPMPTKKSGMNAHLVDDKIYLIGGTSNEEIRIDNRVTREIINVTEVYDPITDTWTTKTPIPTPVSYYASAVVDGKIYVIGGYTREANSTTLNRVNLTQIYDPKTDTWKIGTPIPNAESGRSAATTSGVLAPKRIYVIGGGLNQVYDPANDNWTLATPIQRTNRMENFGDVIVICLNDQLYAIGGIFKEENHYSINDQYTPIGYREASSTTPTSTPKSTEQPSTSSPNITLASPSPTVPEFNSVAILVLAATTGITAFTLRKRHQ
ncbi:MAG: hypothetical protein NWF00_10375 [Candidatus Bathyarchaeota archaeon]|nr:hypothetical protein [Candidatus Bathyarchaeota archaeon]